MAELGERVVLVILADDYGDPLRGPSFEFETFVPVLRSFFEDVVVFPQDRELRARGYFGASAALTELVSRVKPGLLICVPFENQVDWEGMARITRTGVPTLAWMCDDHWRWNSFSRHIAPSFRAVVTTDREAYVRYHQLPGVLPILSQWGVDVLRLRPPTSKRDIDVSFVGARRAHREGMIDALRGANIDVYVRGSGWPEGRASTAELIEIPARSRISLNFSDASRSHAAGSTQLKARPFELAASGTCVVTEPDPQLGQFYKEGEEIVVVDGSKALVSSVRSLLVDEEARMSFAERSWRRTSDEHTYQARFAKIFSALSLDFRSPSAEGSLCVTR